MPYLLPQQVQLLRENVFYFHGFLGDGMIDSIETAAVVDHPSYISHKLCDCLVFSLLKLLLHWRQQTKGVNSMQQTRDTTTQTWITYSNCNIYRVHKLHQRFILKKKDALQWNTQLPFQAHLPDLATQVYSGIWQNFHSRSGIVLWSWKWLNICTSTFTREPQWIAVTWNRLRLTVPVDKPAVEMTN